MKTFIIAFFASIALLLPLTAAASTDIDDVTMSMMDDDVSSSEGAEIDIPGSDDGPNHDLDDDSSNSGSHDDNENESDDNESESEDENEDAEDNNEIDDNDDTDEVEDNEKSDDSDDDSKK